MKPSLLIACAFAALALSACKKEPTPLSRVNASNPVDYTPPTTRLPETENPAQLTPLADPTKLESVTNSGDKFVMQSGEEVDLKTFGLKPYPNLIASEGKPQTTFTKSDSGVDANITVFTKDKPSAVADFYADQITSHKSKSVTQNTAVVGGITANSAEVFIVATQLEGKTQISITAGIDKDQ